MSGNSPHIIVTEVPPGFLKRRNVRGHFSKFGEIVRVSLQNSFCVVTFVNHEQALNAVTLGTKWNDMPMKIDFTPNHDPFGSDDAVINEELNWFAEEPGFSEKVKKKAIRPKSGISFEVPPQKLGRIDLTEDRESLKPSEYKHQSKCPDVLKATKRHSSGRHSATSRFLDGLKTRSKRSEDRISTKLSKESKTSKSDEVNFRFLSRLSDDNKDKTKFPDTKMPFKNMDDSKIQAYDEEEPFQTYSDDSIGRSKIFNKNRPDYKALEDEKSILRVAQDDNRERRESSPIKVDYLKSEGKSSFRFPDTIKSERDPSPVVSSQIKSEGKSILRNLGDRKSEREPSPKTIDYLRSDEKTRIKEISSAVSESYKSEGRSVLKMYDEKKRDSEYMVVDSNIAEEYKIYSKNIEENTRSSDDKSSKILDENKISLKPNENPFYSRVVHTLKDKLDILEERDRQLRLKPEITEMECVLQGTCPDMCPEKERILREVRNMVAPYEASTDGRMDHGKAVKEYTRSSADQGKPLPHELRPEPVLTMTMSYLINCIISRIDEVEEENLQNWYDFCWGRLRAIRKDIIQQDLCDENTVLILEHCARFHIACYDRLWGLSKSLFDDKLNTETLNNCLTSLIKCYKDLRHHGTICPNEAEFNSYLILLNMNNGGFLLSEYQKFTSDLKKSPVIKEAVKIHLAYHNNMFATYFKLIKNTSYLNACLAQRFFQHVRIEALNTIIKSHCTQNKLSSLSGRFIMNMLKLDSIDDCLNFCESTGINYSRDDKCFKIIRNDFYISEYIYKIETPSMLVVNKRIPIAEAVTGQHRTLPLYLKHTVHESFTADGFFKESAIDAFDQEEKMLRDNIKRKLFINHLKTTFTHETSQRQTEEKSSSPKSENRELNNQEEVAEKLFTENENSAEYETVIGSELLSDESKTVMDSTDCSMDSNVLPFVPRKTSPPKPQIHEFNISVPIVFPVSTPIQQSNYFTQTFQAKNSLSNTKNAAATSELLLKSDLPLQKDIEVVSLGPPNSKLMLSEAYEKSDENFSTWTETLKPSEETPKEFSFQLHPISSPSKVETPKKEHVSPKLHSPMNKSISPRAQPREWSTSKSLGESSIKWEKSLAKKLDKSSKKSANFDKLRKKLSETMKKVSARKYLRAWKEKAAKLKSSRELEAMVQHNVSAKDYLKLWGRPMLNKSLTLSNRLSTRKNAYLMVKAILQTDFLSKVDNNDKKIRHQVVNALGETSVKKAEIWGNVAQPNPVYWKLVLALPNMSEGGTTFGLKLRSWCKAVFYPSENGQLSGVNLQVAECGVPVIYSIHVTEGINDLRDCANLSALIIIRVRDWETPDETVNRIGKLVSVGNHPIPVRILYIENELDQVSIENTERIASIEHHIWKNSDTIHECLLNLAQNAYLLNIKVKPLCMVVELHSEKLLDSLRLDRFLHDELDRTLSDPNNIINIYNQLIDQIFKEIHVCQTRNYLGTAFEFRKSLEKYSDFFMYPDNYHDENYWESISLRSKTCKLKPLKTQFDCAKDLINFYKNYCEDAGCSGVFRTLLRYISLPDDDSGKSISDYLKSLQWLPFIEMIIKDILNSHFLTFKVAYRENILLDILESRYWLLPENVVE